MDVIRFFQFKVKLQILADCHLPQNKVSAIRGGMGQMLLAQNCIRNGECEKCSLVNSCIVRNVMYAPFKITPSFSTEKTSMGYVIDCMDMRIRWRAGECLCFDFTLFGDAIAYFMPIVYALTLLGEKGLGNEMAQFRMVEITNRHEKPILRNGNITLSNVLVETVGDYVRERMKYVRGNGESSELYLKSPCAVKHHGEFLTEFDGKSIMVSILRRVNMYRMYEGCEKSMEYWEEEEFPTVESQEIHMKTIPRYSSTQQRKMYLKGMQGKIRLAGCGKKVQELLYAAEILHIGKNTRFGFGRVQVSEWDKIQNMEEENNG